MIQFRLSATTLAGYNFFSTFVVISIIYRVFISGLAIYPTSKSTEPFLNDSFIDVTCEFLFAVVGDETLIECFSYSSGFFFGSVNPIR